MNPPPPFPPYHQPQPSSNSLPPPFSPVTPPPAASHFQPLPVTAAPDLSTALYALSSLLRLTETTLNSLSPFLPTPPPPSTSLVPCPFNPNHRLPHSSLFSHYLSCPSSFAPIPDPQSLLDPLHYPQALHSIPTKSSRQILQNPSSPELRFSLKYFLNFPQNFFYFNCPAAVIVDPSDTNGSSSPMFSLPGILSGECANFRHDNDLDEKGIILESIRIFPSEIWAVRNETDGWVDYPSSYSCRLLRSILSLCKREFSGLLPWVIENSPRYGIVIDSAMRDHIVLLFKLCLKAIVREAISFWRFLLNKMDGNGMSMGEKRFDCPILMKAIMWLGSQLAVLYGEGNGKSFAINMLKHCVVDSALSVLCFPVFEKAKESSDTKEHGKSEGALGNSGKEEQRRIMPESVQKCHIFVNQVAASVAALYERLSLEEKIKSSRDSSQLTAYQRVVEHESIISTANEERQKRSNYRPIIEHDGILSKRRQNQETNRTKTREELLAEERDYKRRRMSYRGKKTKRSITQVMRDMIDEFMDEIKLAGGFDFAKDVEGSEATALGYSPGHNIASDAEFTKDQSAAELPIAQPHVYARASHSDGVHPKNFEDNDGEQYGKKKHVSGSNRGTADNDRSSRRVRHDRKDNSSDHSQKRSSKDLKEHSRNRSKQDDPVVSGETSSRSSSRKLKKHKDRRADSVHTDFEDRYDSSSTRHELDGYS